MSKAEGLKSDREMEKSKSRLIEMLTPEERSLLR